MVTDTPKHEMTPEQKALNDWLPVTSNRGGKWWFSTVHNVTAMVGAGVLSLPYAMSQMGWGFGTVVLFMSWVITFYTIWQMVQLHEMVPGKRFDRYHELGQHAFGEKLGLWIVVPQQLTVDFSSCIVYMVTGGKSLKKIHEILCPECKPIKLTYFIMMFSCVQFVLSQLPNFNSITAVSFGAALMSISYSMIAFGATMFKGANEDVSYSSRSTNSQENAFGFLSSLGDMAFAFAGHNVVLEIQATLPSTPDKSSKGPMWRGVWMAYVLVAVCYFPVAIAGYWAFGNRVEDNIMMSLEKPNWLIAAANVFVVIHVIGSYQVFAMPVFDMLETFLVKKLKFKPSALLRATARTAFVATTMAIGVTLPFFGGLLGFFGGFAFAPGSYFLPGIIWLIICKPKRFGLSWWCNWFCIVTGILLTLCAPVGGLYNIIKSAKDYKFYS